MIASQVEHNEKVCKIMTFRLFTIYRRTKVFLEDILEGFSFLAEGNLYNGIVITEAVRVFNCLDKFSDPCCFVFGGVYLDIPDVCQLMDVNGL